MSTVTVKFLPSELMRNFLMAGRAHRMQWVKDNLKNYSDSMTFELVGYNPEDCCEEMFDISNNPSRQVERAKMFGKYRSISVGDVVVVDEVKWICDSIGWKKIEEDWFNSDELTPTELANLEMIGE